MAKNKSIVWKIVTKKLSELKLYEKNPRTITEQGLKDLKKSIDKFGLAEPIIINTDNTIIGGHARYLTLKGNNEIECDCYIPNMKLNDKEVEELNIRLNKNIAGVFDFDILANQFDVNELLNWGFEKWEFGILEKESIDDDIYKGLPQDSQDGIPSFKEINVKFLNEEDYVSFAKLVKQNLTQDTKYIWYPKQYFDQYNNKKALVSKRKK